LGELGIEVLDGSQEFIGIPKNPNILIDAKHNGFRSYRNMTLRCIIWKEKRISEPMHCQERMEKKTKKEINQDVIVLPAETLSKNGNHRPKGTTEKSWNNTMIHQWQDHPGNKKNVKSLQRDFDWPGMENEVKEYVKGCMECQRNKAD